MPYRFKLRVYYEDTDAGGVVYYANYLKFAERARTEMVRAAGIDQSELLEQEDIAFVVRKCSADFIRPARLDDELTIESHITELKGASIHMHQEILRGDEVLVKLEVKLGVVGKDFTPIRIPNQIAEKLVNDS